MVNFVSVPVTPTTYHGGLSTALLVFLGCECAGRSAGVALCNLGGLSGTFGEIFEKNLTVLLSGLKASFLW